MRVPRSLPVLIAGLAAALLAACSDGGDVEDLTPTDDEADATIEVEETAEPDGAPAEVRTHRWVQDLWVVERYDRIADDGRLVDLLGPVVAELGDDADEIVDLPGGARFHVHERLAPRMRDGRDGTLRSDVRTTAGLLEYEGVRALAILATPDPDADAPIGLDDEPEVDLTFLTDLAPGDVTLADVALVSATPTLDPVEAALGEVELFAWRMEQQQILYLGGEEMGGTFDEDGGAEVLLRADVVSMAREGSTYGGAGSKSPNVVNGIGEGMRGCRGGLRCASSVFRSTQQAFARDMRQIRRNLLPDPPPLLPPSRPIGPEDGGEPRFEPPCRRDPCGRATGDPHLGTFEGPQYRMMAVGEFVLVRNGDLEVQVRTEPAGTSTTVSAVRVAAVQLGDVVVTNDRADPQAVLIDGERVAIVDLAEGRELGGVTVSATGQVVVVEDAAHRVAMRPRSSFVDVWVQLDEQDPQAEGLLGRIEGADASPWVTRDGTELEVVTGPSSFEVVYGQLVPSWRVEDAESILPYGDGESTATFTDLDFPSEPVSAETLPPAEVARAEVVCRAVGILGEAELEACVIDLVMTGEIAFVHSAQVADRVRRAIDEGTDVTAPRRLDLEDGATIETPASVGPSADPTPPDGRATAPAVPGPREVAWAFADARVDDVLVRATQVPGAIAQATVEPGPGIRQMELLPGRGPFGDVLRVALRPAAFDIDEAVANETYVSFRLRPGGSVTSGPVAVTGVRVTAARSALTSVTTVELRSSTDGFARSLATFELDAVQPEMERFVVDLDDAVALDGATEFRLYVLDAATRGADLAELSFVLDR